MGTNLEGEAIMDILRAVRRWAAGGALAAVVAAGLFWAPAQAAGGTPVREDRVRGPLAALESLRKAYSEENTDAFFSNVHENAIFNTTDLKQRLADQFSHTGDIDLRFFTGKELAEGDKTLLRVRWQKRFTRNSTGEVAVEEGVTDFIFSKSAQDRSYKLVNIQKDDPF